MKETICKTEMEDDGHVDHEGVVRLKMQEMINETDADGNSTIDLLEFLPLTVGKVKDNIDEELVEAFMVFDFDDNGFGCAAESRRWTTNVGEKAAVLASQGLDDEQIDQVRGR